MNQFFDVPAGGRRRLAAVCAAVLLLAAVATEGADTGSVPLAAAWTVSGGLVLAAVTVRRDRLGPAAAAGICASCLVTLVNSQVAARPEVTFGMVEACALLLVVVRTVRLRPPLRAVALAGGALAALTVLVLRLTPEELSATAPLVVPALWFAFALAAVLGLYLRLLDRYRAQQHEAGLQAQRLDYARELHDFVGHHVTAIIAQTKAVRFATAAGRPPGPEELDGMLAAIEEAGSQAMQSMRGMVAVLRSPDGTAPTAEPGGLGDLRALTARFAAAGPATTLTLDPRLAAGGLPPGIATTVHHVVRESLTNVRKHAGRATAVTVDVRLDGDTAHPVVQVSVTDDGPDAAGPAARSTTEGDGPARGPRAARSGYGLVGLSERAAMVGGTVTAQARPGVGWSVEARIPLPGPLPAPTGEPAPVTLDA
ncbi:sensor histidine kinase [Streptomyces sp. NPDC006012]|uniref:sensor histidine kinase n=1 Tax=Streptomyces sp. NPDC006012 TaxID=3364739 RepID=UPI0036C500E8